MCFPYVQQKPFSTLLVFGSVSTYLSTGQRSVCSVNCPSRGGCRQRRCLQTPCGCSESLAPPPGSWAPWLGGCPSSAASQRAGPCWEETTLGIRKCTVTVRRIKWFTWSLPLGGVTARTTLQCVFAEAKVYSVIPHVIPHLSRVKVKIIVWFCAQCQEREKSVFYGLNRSNFVVNLQKPPQHGLMCEGNRSCSDERRKAFRLCEVGEEKLIKRAKSNRRRERLHSSQTLRGQSVLKMWPRNLGRLCNIIHILNKGCGTAHQH